MIMLRANRLLFPLASLVSSSVRCYSPSPLIRISLQQRQRIWNDSINSSLNASTVLNRRYNVSPVLPAAEGGMFKTLSSRFLGAMNGLLNKHKLTKADVEECLRLVRVALLEADVAPSIVDAFIAKIMNDAVGTRVEIPTGPAVLSMVHNHLVQLLGTKPTPINLGTSKPASVLMVGIQGSGKTTSTGKLGLYLKKQGRKVLMVSLDTRRPAAQQQLAVLGEQARVSTLPVVFGQKPEQITERAFSYAKDFNFDTILFDTAGRLHVDTELMEELKGLTQIIKPTEIFLVADSMMGQEAVATAQAFHSTVKCSGVVLTRLDGDARGGAALSITQTVGVPIKMMGNGEKMENLIDFDPKAIADRIVGKSEVLNLITQVEDGMTSSEKTNFVDHAQSNSFDLNDFLIFCRQLSKVGGVASILGHLPGMSMAAQSARAAEIFSHGELEQWTKVIGTLTDDEKKQPKNLKADRKLQIAHQTGVDVASINAMVKKFDAVKVSVQRWQQFQSKNQSANNNANNNDSQKKKLQQKKK